MFFFASAFVCIHHPYLPVSPEMCSTRDVLRETLAEEHHRDKWTMFGNEAEKVELDVMRNQRALRRRGDAAAFRKQVKDPRNDCLVLS